LADEVAVVEVATSSGLISVVAPMMAEGTLNFPHTQASDGRSDGAAPKDGLWVEVGR